jgi:prepilin-type N-terminal cleavage/methylation domain-containing protein
MFNRKHEEKNMGFTLIELLVVIAIIGILSTIVLASVNSARSKAKDTAARATTKHILNQIAQCDIDGGYLMNPDSVTAPTNNICSLGASYGKWPNPPDSWKWHSPVVTAPGVHIIRMDRVIDYGGSISFAYCGFFPPWANNCTAGNDTGLCRISQSYACAYYDTALNQWK